MNGIKRVLVSSLLLSTLIPAAPAFADGSGKVIADLAAADSWATTAITDVTKIGWMSGDPSGHFRPHDPITRREIAVIITKILNLDTPDVKYLSYTDVLPSDWGLKYIEAVKKAGIMSGSDGHFRPNDLITREELAVILAKAAHLSTMDSTRLSLINEKLSFADKDAIHDWAKASVLAAVNAGIMGGNGNYFIPQEHATREEVAVVLQKLAKKIGYVKLYSGTWSAKLGNMNLYLVIDNSGNSTNVTFYDDKTTAAHPYFSMPLTFNSGAAQFDTKDYAGSIRLNGDQIVFDLIIKDTNSVTILGGKRISNCVFVKQG